MGLVPQPPGRIAAGEILFEGEDLLKLPPERLRDLRGDKLSMIFQEPMTSLNPVFPVGDQIAEAILRHRGVTAREARAQTIEMLHRVRIPSPEQRADDYPHQLSGGMRQRAMTASRRGSPPSTASSPMPPRCPPAAASIRDVHLPRRNAEAKYLPWQRSKKTTSPHAGGHLCEPTAPARRAAGEALQGGSRGRRHQFRALHRGNSGPSRRIGLRQVDRGPLAAAPDRADIGQGLVRRAGSLLPC